VAWNERKLLQPRDVEAAAAYVNVGKVDPDRALTDARLAGMRRRQRNVLIAQHFRPAIDMNAHGFGHGALCAEHSTARKQQARRRRRAYGRSQSRARDQNCAASFCKPMTCTSWRTSFFCCSLNIMISGIAAFLSCCTSAPSASIAASLPPDLLTLYAMPRSAASTPGQ